MNAAAESLRGWGRDVAALWNRFWFEPQQPQTLALIRICAGAMLLYTHLVWTLDLNAFLGPTGLVSPRASMILNQGPDGGLYVWSHFWAIRSPAMIWTVHLAALVVFGMLTIGLYTRVVSVLACILTISYCHRLTGALFGLDQINALLATYLMVGPSGAVYSVDRWLADRRGLPAPGPSPWTTIAVRLIQLHMCIIYLFGGIGKMRGGMWWDGSAMWFAIANLEYQSLDITWLVRWRWLIALLTHVTVFWETFYCFLIWPRLSRPICLALAVAVHGGIGLFLGMKTFALAMLIGNMAFLYPEMVKACVDACLARFYRRVEEPVVPVVSKRPAGSLAAASTERSAGER